MEERLNDTEPLDDLKEQESKLQHEKEGLQIINNDKNISLLWRSHPLLARGALQNYP